MQLAMPAALRVVATAGNRALVGAKGYIAPMDDLSALDMVRSTSDPIHEIGTAIYLSPETFARAAEWGWANPFAFYFGGRGGVLGSTDADVISSAMGYFNPVVLTDLYAEGLAVAGPQGAADRMVEATAAWGRDHLEGVEGLATFVRLADRLVDGAEGAALTLFAGWRAQARVDDTEGRAAQLFQILREWRGAAHLVGTTAVGLTPLEAILTSDGPGQAKFFGWSEPFPDWTGVAALQVDAEAITDDLCAREVDRLLSAVDRRGFADAVIAAAAVLKG